MVGLAGVQGRGYSAGILLSSTVMTMKYGGHLCISKKETEKRSMKKGKVNENYCLEKQQQCLVF